ncbi:MAG: sigma-54-dependent Fis family transcriptional regulator [Desulfuromonadaceae bacterium]|nr:sigma-54-dependent Fis family transcriptional regulator [Desulfuromonadaceae bacterium]
MAIAPPLISYHKDRRKIDSLWDRFEVGHVSLEQLDPYEKTLVNNWMRCKTLGIDSRMHEGLILAEEEYKTACANSSLIIDTSSPILKRVSILLTSVPNILILTDHKGTILSVIGDPSIRVRAAEDSGLVEGACWLESLRGTNGIGTAISQKEPVHIYANEHFCEGWQKWSCAATPILAPDSTEILGVVNFTTFDKDYREDALALTYALSGQIMAEIRLQLELERLQLIQHYSDYSSRYPSENIVILDRMGRPVRHCHDNDPSKISLTNESMLDELPEKIRKIQLKGTESEIGSLLVFKRKSPVVVSLPNRSAQIPCVEMFGDFATANEDLKLIMERVSKVMTSEINVLLFGETGTGKEIVANYIHTHSKRSAGPFVAVNCGAISKELFESKFFGYERGAYTGADPRGRKGLFESANGGTLFLDEVGEMPLDIQAALLRVLETGRFNQVGSDKEISTNCRIIAATNRSLSEEIDRGAFRVDLYFRLGVATFDIPPLRERPEDIPVIIQHTMELLCQKHGVNPSFITPEAMKALTGYSWPGNGREVRNVIESAMICCGDTISVQDLPIKIRQSQKANQQTLPQTDEAASAASSEGSDSVDYRISSSFSHSEVQLIKTTLDKYKDIALTCKALGVSRTTFYRKCNVHGITPSKYT